MRRIAETGTVTVHYSVLRKVLEKKPVTMAVGVPDEGVAVEPTRSIGLNCPAAFRRSLYDCLTLRGDALFELHNAVLCVDGPVTTLAGFR